MKTALYCHNLSLSIFSSAMAWMMVWPSWSFGAIAEIVEGPITGALTTTIFWQEQYLLTPAPQGPGRIVWERTSDDWYDAGTNLTLLAVPDSYHAFEGWTGATNSAENPLTLRVDRPWTNLQARFVPAVTEHGTPLLWYVGYGITNQFEYHDTHDADGDQRVGWEEYVWGTSPVDGNSYPQLLLEREGAGYHVLIPETTNRSRYYVLGRESLRAGEWEELTNAVGVNGPLRVEIPAEAHQVYFYRAKATKIEE